MPVVFVKGLLTGVRPRQQYRAAFNIRKLRGDPRKPWQVAELETGLHEGSSNFGLPLMKAHPVPAAVADLGDLETVIAECDENLCGSNLSPAEVALFTAKRKEAYEALHPETAKPGPNRGKLCHNSFATDTAEKTGDGEQGSVIWATLKQRR